MYLKMDVNPKILLATNKNSLWSMTKSKFQSGCKAYISPLLMKFG